MAGSYNRVMFIGRLTRDPEVRTFQGGGKVASFGFAFTGQRRKNQQSGEWEEEPCFVDVKAFNRQNGRQMADLVERNLVKGKQIAIEGHLILETWTDKDTGSKRSVHRVILDDLIFIGPKEQSGQSSGRDTGYQTQYANDSGGAMPANSEEDIPF